MKKSFHSNGKLLLTGEYVVLDGATALAIPTRFGQSLEMESFSSSQIASVEKVVHWKSLDEKEEVWFQGKFELQDIENTLGDASDLVGNQLLKILQEAKKLNPGFLDFTEEILVNTKLDFPRNWGLGTSSTLINNIAQWAGVDAFRLLAKSFGGSGYDIAAAQNNSSILYRLKDGKPEYKQVDLPWNFTDNLFFVHLNQKQDSKEGISKYRKASINTKSIEEISEISNNLLICNSLSEFEKLMKKHEEMISEIIGLPTMKNQLFSDYPGIVKSLGAWGGDFVLVTGAVSEMEYFRRKGYGTIISFKEMRK